MRIGRLDKRVTVFSHPTVPDGAGGTTEVEPVELLTTWARISTPRAAQRTLITGEIVEGTNYSIWMRWRSDININEDLSLIYNGREFILHSVVNRDEDNKVLEIIAYEKQ